MSDYEEMMAEMTDVEEIDAAIEALKEALAKDILGDTKVTSAQYNEMRKSRDEAKKKMEQMKRDYDELYRRCSGMSSHLARIRRKADTASGYENESGGSMEATIKMRAAGAEGAVDRLIALYCGKLGEQNAPG